MKNYETVTLQTERLILKKGTSSDCQKIYEYDLTKASGIDDQNKFVKFDKPVDFVGDNPTEYYKKCKKEKIFDWYVYLHKNGIPIGNIIADRVDESEKSIELAYNAHPDYWGNGYIPEALEEVIKFLFKLKFKKIVIHFFEGNENSKRVCEKLKFKLVNSEMKYYAPTNKNILEYEYIITDNKKQS